MKNKIIWLRISYWVAGIADFVVAVIVLVPERMGVPEYCYPMGLMSAVAFSWGCLLIWADRKPLERRWVLLPTILVIFMLLIAGLYSIYAGVISIREYLPNFILIPAVIALLSFSYYNARDVE
jgi:hypothetical protein